MLSCPELRGLLWSLEPRQVALPAPTVLPAPCPPTLDDTYPELVAAYAWREGVVFLGLAVNEPHTLTSTFSALVSSCNLGCVVPQLQTAPYSAHNELGTGFLLTLTNI